LPATRDSHLALPRRTGLSQALPEASGLRPQASGSEASGLGPQASGLWPEASGEASPEGCLPPRGVGARLKRLESGDPNPDLPETLTLREVSNRSGIDLAWLRKEASNIGMLVEGVWRVPADQVDRLKLRWLRRRRRKVNESGRGFTTGGNRYRHDGGPQQQ
jgi:hypothetical protein